MVAITFTFKGKALDKTLADIQSSFDIVQDFVETRGLDMLRTDIAPLTTEPREPSLPFIWSHNPAIQRSKRAAYFKTLPRGSRGGRYARSHTLIRGWKTSSYRKPGEVGAIVSNDVPYVETVQGDEQYPSHADSGWVQYTPVLEKAGGKAIGAIVTVFYGTFK